MFDSRKNNSNCSFSEEVISYIYDEFTDSQKSEFESHLVNCTNCTDEIASFGAIRTSIQDWKSSDFDNLALPNINIEFEPNRESVPVVETNTVQVGWLERLNNLFSPVFLKTATGFAAIVLMLTFGWFLFSSYQNGSENIAEDKSNQIDTRKTVETQEKPIEPEKVEIVGTEDNDSDLRKQEAPESEIAVQTNPKRQETATKSTRPVRKNNKNSESKNRVTRKNKVIVANNRKPKVNNKINEKDLIDNKKPNTVVIDKAPSLSDFAIEDTTDEDINLTDIFEEVEEDDSDD